MAKAPTAMADRIRMLAARERVFTNDDLKAALGDKAPTAAMSLVKSGEIVRHAVGVYAIGGVGPTDQRVMDAVKRSNASPIRTSVAEAHARAVEERRARSTHVKAVGVSLVDQVREHFSRHDVAMRSELNKTIGAGAGQAAEALVRTGTLKRIEDGLYAKPHVDAFGPELQAYIERNSIELAAIRREIERDIAALPPTTGTDGISYDLWTPAPMMKDGREVRRPTRMYVNIPGLPPIYGQSEGRKGSVGIRWAGGRDTTLGAHAAEHIARMVFDPMPATYPELLNLVARGEAPRQTRRRSGGYDVTRGVAPPGTQRADDGSHDRGRGDAGEDWKPEPREAAYGTHDTGRLDPKRLGKPLPEPVTLEIDDRESDYLVTRLTGVENLHILRTRLSIGDFRARHRGREVIFERKTSNDLTASMQDGRLTSQVRAMSEHGSPVVFLIEGGMFGSRTQPILKLAAVQSRLLFGMDMRIMETIDQNHTAYALVVAIRDRFFGTGDKFALAPVRIPGASPIEVAKAMLETTPGISPVRSSALLRRFGSLVGVANATIKEIAAIDGIGATTAARLRATFDAGTPPAG